MSEYQTDEEKVEALKKWWFDNGYYLIGGLVIGFGILIGWDWYKAHKVEHSRAASSVFSNVLEGVNADKPAINTALVEQLGKDYADTPYYVFAELEAARVFAEKGELEQAAKSLQTVVDKGVDLNVADLARVRLARVKVALNDAEGALSLVDAVKDPAFMSLREEVRGDALVAQGKPDEARDAYDKAILTANGQNQFLQLKRDNLGNKTGS